MTVRPFITASAIVAATGVLALTPAVVPPLTQRDVQVAKDVSVKLAAIDYESIVNTFFGKPPGSTDAPGLWGVSGVAHQFAKQLAGPVEANQNLVDGFFALGVSEVVRQYMMANTVPDSPQADLIDGFFSGGITEVVRQLVLANTSNEAMVPFINAFFDQNQSNPALKGIPGVIYLRLKAAGLSDDQEAVLDDFFEGGATQVVWHQLLARTSDPQQIETINDFFTGGATQVVRTQLLSRTSDPNQLADIAAFFPDAYTGYEGGISENVRIRLLAATADPAQQDLINGFFDEGISEVVRYLLVGPAPDGFSAFSARMAPEALPAAAPVEEPAPSAPAPAVEAVDAQEPEVTADPNDDVATTIKGGNKFEVAPVIPFGAGKGGKGSGSWGVFGQVADSVAKTLAGAVKPAAGSGSPAADAAGSAGSED